jgi:autotransporter-associated beta strand protein
VVSVVRSVLVGAVLWLSVTATYGQNATWLLAPGSSDFDTAANWTPATVPTGTANFGASNTTSITFSSGTFIDTLQFNAGAPAYSFGVSGSFLEMTGTGIVNNSSNAPTINNTGPAGTFFVNASTAGSATITNSGSGSTEFSNTSTAGSASITNNSGGNTFFVGSSTAGNATITTNSGSFLEINNASTAGSATIVTNSGGFTIFQNSGTGGQAQFTTNSGGTFDMSGLSTGGMTAGSIAGAGAYNLGPNQLTVGSNNLSTVVSGTIADGGIFGGTGGSLVKVGAGTLVVTGSNTYTGGTTISAGTLQLGNGGTSGSIVGNVVNNANLAFSRSDNITFGGLISGTGTLNQLGPGVLTLSNANTYSGPTNVNAGTLDVAGSIASSSLITVANGASLTGTGTVGNTRINSGIFAPGAAGVAGTSTTIAGNLAFASGAIYRVYLNPTTSSFSTVTGTASLAGTVNANFAPGSYLAKQYAILQSAGLSGTAFSALTTTNLPDGFAASLAYTNDDVLLKLTATLGALSPGGLNVNQQNVANALNNYFNSGAALPPNFVSVFGLTNGSLASALTQLDGQVATGAERAAFQLTDEFLALMLDPFVNGRGGVGPSSSAIGFAPDEQKRLPPDIALAYAGVLKAPPPTFEQRWTVWGSAYGGSNMASGNAAVGSNNVTASTYGFAGGMDYHLSPYTVVGFALAGAGTNWGLANALGTSRSDALQVGAYGITWFGRAYVAGALAFTNHWFTSDRSALGDQLTTNFDGQSYGTRLEAGYRYAVLPTLGVTPYGAVQAQDFHTPSYSESAMTGGGFGLSYAAMNATDVRTELGARFDNPTLLYGKPLILFGRVAWAHDFVSNPSLNAAFESLPGSTFTVYGAPIPHDSALTTAGAQLFLTPQWTLLAKFDGEFAPGSQTYAGTGTLRYTW